VAAIWSQPGVPAGANDWHEILCRPAQGVVVTLSSRRCRV